MPNNLTAEWERLNPGCEVVEMPTYTIYIGTLHPPYIDTLHPPKPRQLHLRSDMPEIIASRKPTIGYEPVNHTTVGFKWSE